jgi:hypothetical protein
LIKKLLLLAAASFSVALAVAIYWDATDICADCASTFYFDNIARLMGEEGAAAGVLFFLGALLGIVVERSVKDSQNA